jgi:hypothetical protein
MGIHGQMPKLPNGIAELKAETASETSVNRAGTIINAVLVISLLVSVKLLMVYTSQNTSGGTLAVIIVFYSYLTVDNGSI